MPRRRDRKQINLTVSAAQFQAALILAAAAGQPISDFMRNLLAMEAARRGIVWPEDLTERGKYPREK